ncbi:hypothetical protein [Nonomuraea helvata]|uniref:DUF21 domain-containing protein n=1 Tax=Nonomuraea helvata TaxID=37484 RepID=A0ABV5SI82_9ACTN
MSALEFAATLVNALAWPTVAIAAIIILRNPLSGAFTRVSRVEALGVITEFAQVEKAREAVQEVLADEHSPNVDELVQRATVLGWQLGRIAPSISPQLVVDRSHGTPRVRSSASGMGEIGGECSRGLRALVFMLRVGSVWWCAGDGRAVLPDLWDAAVLDVSPDTAARRYRT